MPQSILIALILFVALYGVVVGTAAVRALVRRGSAPEPSSSLSSVTIVAPDNTETVEAIRQASRQVRDLDVRIEIVRRRNDGLDVPLSAGAAARNEVVLLPGAACDAGPEWIQSMSAHCTRDAPLVAGPTLVRHDDHFLPRLEALQHIGHTALLRGLTSTPPPRNDSCANLAVRPEAVPKGDGRPMDDGNERRTVTSEEATFVDDPDAALSCPPASSFDEYFSRLVNTVRTTVRSSAVPGKLIGVALWTTHSLLLACCVGAVALPSWRQPTLLALLGKMGADGFLLAPATRQYGERGLLRSFVPSELLLVIVLPFAGLFAFPSLHGIIEVHPSTP